MIATNKRVKRTLAYAGLALLAGFGLWTKPGHYLAFGSTANLNSKTSSGTPTTNSNEAQVQLVIRKQGIFSHDSAQKSLRLTGQVTVNGAEMPCDGLTWYYTRKDAFYLGLQPEFRGCSGVVSLPNGDWDISAVYIKDNLSAYQTLSFSLTDESFYSNSTVH
jgi:hypothetical protein